MWVVVVVTEYRQRREQAPLLPLRPLIHIQHHSTATWVAPSWGMPKAPPLYVTGAPRTTTKKMAQMKEHIKSPEKIQLSNEERANLLYAQFRTLVIRKLTELVEFGHRSVEKMKAMLRETKENV